MSARRVALGTAALLASAAAAAPAASAEAAIWLDAKPSPSVPQLGILYNQRLFNNDLYDTPFYRAVAGTRTPLFGEVTNDTGGPGVGATVYIYSLKKGQRTLRRIARFRAGAHGAFQFLAPKATIQTAYVAFTAGVLHRGGTVPIPAISNPVFLRVAPRLSVPALLRSTGSARIAGRISPAPRGTVSLWLLNGKRPRRVAAQAISRKGTFAFTRAYGASGEYDYGVLVQPAKDSGYDAQYDTTTVQVQIPIPAPPPPPPVVSAPAAASGPPPSSSDTTSSGFGGSCTAFGCTKAGRERIMRALAVRLLRGDTAIPVSALPKPSR